MKIFILIFCFINVIIGKYIFELKKSNIRKLEDKEQLTKNHFDSSGVYGNSSTLYYYYINIYIGTPFKRQSLIIDTGSSFMGIPCKTVCKSCGNHLNSYYDFKNSNSSSILTCKNASEVNVKCDFCEGNDCKFSQSYGEGSSYSGLFIEDEILFGDSYHLFDSIKTPIGCIDTETYLFYSQQADGILGLAPENKRSEHIISYLHRNQKINNKLFSLCFGTDGGYFSLGGVNHTFHLEDKINYLQMIPNEFYKVDVVSFKIENNEFVLKKEYFTIIDSGTTVTYLPRDLFKQVIDRLKQDCNKNDNDKCLGYMHYESGDLCIDQRYDISLDKFFNSFSTIKIKFNSEIEISWKPENYLVFLKERTYCIGINDWGRNEVLLGTTFMHNKDIIFDLENNRIGLISANCSANINGFSKRHQTLEEEKNCQGGIQENKESSSSSLVLFLIINFSVLLLGILLLYGKIKNIIKNILARIIPTRFSQNTVIQLPNEASDF